MNFSRTGLRVAIVIKIRAWKSILDSRRKRRLVSYSMYVRSIRRGRGEEEGQPVLRATDQHSAYCYRETRERKEGKDGGRRKELLDVIDEPTSNIPLRRGQLTRTPR